MNDNLSFFRRGNENPQPKKINSSKSKSLTNQCTNREYISTDIKFYI